MLVTWSPDALRRLVEIRDFIRGDSPRAATETVRRIRTVSVNLAAHPEIGRTGRIEGTREYVVPRTPYIVPYRINDGRIEIISIMHGAQEWPDSF